MASGEWIGADSPPLQSMSHGLGPGGLGWNRPAPQLGKGTVQNARFGCSRTPGRDRGTRITPRGNPKQTDPGTLLRTHRKKTRPERAGESSRAGKGLNRNCAAGGSAELLDGVVKGLEVHTSHGYIVRSCLREEKEKKEEGAMCLWKPEDNLECSDQADIELTPCLPLLPECWDERHAPPHLVLASF
ncbi:uncharacterized protein LOC110300008 [Mus caroli]|uniref:Uncharacterized protein LOC110300008 n=1 Tax=Mus caroli TaxID=10089 RepID=A0A6P5Q734_MUSCR|nr:uncharacterized protein LOC110300008 [Mus caroli]